MTERYDFIVVGAGTAGSLMANRLSADPDKRVLLLEAGGKDNYHWIHIPVGYLYCIDNPRTDWRFRTEQEKGLNGRSLLYPRGKVLGGCSSINGMIYMRGQARDYDSWANETGENEWSWSACLDDFKAHEDNYRLDGAGETSDGLHRGGGEWRIEEQRLRWEILEAFIAASEEAGIPKSPDFNTGDNTGVGYFEVNQRSGWRWNTSKAFLKPVSGRPNLDVVTGAHVHKLVLKKTADGAAECTGVQAAVAGSQVTYEARCEVILCSGAIGTPHILQLSGIGDTGLLKEQGIETVHERSGVGRNLQDHLQLRTIFRVQDVKTLNEIAATPWGKAAIGLEYLLKRSGPMSMAPSQLGVFTKSDPARDHSNIQFHVQPLSLESFGQPLHPWPGVTSSVCNLNPTSRGTVTLKSADPNEAPAIAPNYLDTEDDRQVAADSIRIARKIMGQGALARYQPVEVKPGADHQSDTELAEAAGNIGTTIFHPVGTAKMGRPDDPLAVVDSKLRVIGMKGLRVADASIMPTITSGNTNSPTLMIAEKAARWIRASH